MRGVMEPAARAYIDQAEATVRLGAQVGARVGPRVDSKVGSKVGP